MEVYVMTICSDNVNIVLEFKNGENICCKKDLSVNILVA